MFMIEHKETGWRYWLATAVLLTIGLLADPVGFLLAIGLTVIQLIHFLIRQGSVSAFPVQVRFWYLMLLLVALPAPLQWIFWMPAIGTWAQLLFGYCAMARLVSLFPWNRSERFSVALLKKTIFSRPVRGNIKQGFAAAR